MKRFLAVFLGAVMVLTCLEFGSVSASAEGNSGVIELPPVLLTGGNTGEIQTPEDLFATLSSIAVTTPPTKTSYLEGKDTLDLTGGILTLTLDDASTQTVALTDEAVTVTGFDNTQVGTDTLTVSYGGKETTFDVTITAKSAASIAIKTAPTKSEYTVGDTLDVTGGEITVTYDNETSADVAITADMVSGFDSSAAAASQTLTVTYEGKTATFDISIVAGGSTDPIITPVDPFPTLDTITVSTPPTKTSYLEGKDTLDLTGGILTLTFTDNTTMTVDLTDTEKVAVTGFDNTTPGTNTLTVKCGGKETTFDVTITAKSAVSIAIKTAPTKSEYTVGDTLDVTGGEITVTYDNETSADVAITADMVSGFDSSAAAASQTLTVTYEGKTATFDISIVAGGSTDPIITPEDPIPTLKSITVSTPPTKTSYLEGKDTLDLTGGVLTLTFDDDTTMTVDLTDTEKVAVTGFDNTTPGTNTLTVKCGGKETTFDVTITAKSAASIAIKTAPTKSEYTVGDALDVTGGEITVTYDNETSADVAITADMVSGFDSSAAAASQTLTVTYEGKTATFDISIVAGGSTDPIITPEDPIANLASIAVTTLPTKTEYLEAKDALDLTGGVLTLTFDDDTTKTVDLSDSEKVAVTGFDNTTPGTNTLTVKCGGKETTFDVTIKAKSVASVEIKTNPAKTEYQAGEELDLTGAKATVTYDNGTAAEIDVTPELVSGFDSTTPGTKTVTVTVGDKTATFTVTVAEPVPVNDPIENIFGNSDSDYERSSGKSRYNTAVETANRLKKALGVDSFGIIIIACGTNFPDALAGSYLAARFSAPILMVGKTGDGEADALAFISENLASGGTVYILGGTGAVPQSTEDALKARSVNVERIKGANRYITNIEILNKATVDAGAELLIANGANFADALSASALGRPLLLVEKDKGSLSAEQIAWLSSHSFSKIYILGGTGAVPESFVSALSSVTGVTPKRLSGKSRYDTSVVIAKEFFPTTVCMTLATGTNFPDGLTGGPLAFTLNAPMVLTNKAASDYAKAAAYAKEANVQKFLVFGGESAMPDAVVRAIMAK